MINNAFLLMGIVFFQKLCFPRQLNVLVTIPDSEQTINVIAFRDSLDVTLDLMNNKQSDSPVKVGELMCLFKGMHIELPSANTRKREVLAKRSSSNSITSAQTNSTEAHSHTLLNGAVFVYL